MFDCALLRQEEKSVWESVKQPLYNIHINSLCWVQSKINLLPYERLFYVSQNKVQEIIKIAPGKWLKKCSISGFHVVKEANCTISIENNNNNGDKNSNALTHQILHASLLRTIYFRVFLHFSEQMIYIAKILSEM